MGEVSCKNKNKIHIATVVEVDSNHNTSSSLHCSPRNRRNRNKESSDNEKRQLIRDSKNPFIICDNLIPLHCLPIGYASCIIKVFHKQEESLHLIHHRREGSSFKKPTIGLLQQERKFKYYYEKIIGLITIRCKNHWNYVFGWHCNDIEKSCNRFRCHQRQEQQYGKALVRAILSIGVDVVCRRRPRFGLCPRQKRP